MRPVRRTKSRWQNFIVSILFGLISFGEIWIFAWIFNPNFTSGTVSFFASIYALLSVAIMNGTTYV